MLPLDARHRLQDDHRRKVGHAGGGGEGEIGGGGGVGHAAVARGLLPELPGRRGRQVDERIDIGVVQADAVRGDARDDVDLDAGVI